ncbi:MAG: xanthine dehydrogenase family protein molybdopterin-binding subunit, partial [Proteobacteria bacterium]|nr:xanthine dehydrogenase family protein molybdopterin-binding subunit [Pseudomonadota bacterium]
MLIGKALTRDEDDRLLRGRGTYVDDVNLPGAAHAAFVHSPHAHARIKSIDTRAAQSMPGVLSVLTDADWQADALGVLPVVHPVDFYDGRPMNEAPRPVFARDRVCYVGDNVACVIAETIFQAMDAAEAVVVDYEPLPALVDTGQALAQGAVVVHQQFGTNEAQEWRLGDKELTEHAIREAHHVTELTLISNRVAGAAIENRTYAGDYDCVTDRYTLYAAGQMPHWYRQWIARDALFIPEHKVRVIVPDVGGGFGPKAFFYMEMPVILWAAKRLRRPVRWVAQRSESFATDTHGRDHVTQAKMAFDRDGRVLALQVETTACLGAYHNPFAAGIACMFYPGTLTGPYQTPAAYVSVRGVYTNTAPVDAYRGSGRPEATFVNERLFENGARELGIDPLEMRRRNYIKATDYPFKTPLGRTWDSGNPRGLHDKLLQLTEYDGLRREQAVLREQGTRMGIGAAAFVETSGAGPSRRNAAMKHWSGGFETALIRVHSDAKVTVFTGSHSQGQGHDITFRQIAADTLGMALKDIDYVEGDTDRIPAGCGTWAWRSL